MANFTFTPDRNFPVNIKPDVKTAKFGEGYSQRTTNDINPLTREWQLTFRNREVFEINNITSFFETYNGAGAFTWTPPGDSNSYSVICQDWSITYVTEDIRTLNAKFIQVYEEVL